MEKFEVTSFADRLEMKAFCKNYHELLANCAYGMFSIISGKLLSKSLDQRKTELIKIPFTSDSETLVLFLNELLYRSDMNNKVYCGFSFLESPKEQLTFLAYYQKREKIKTPRYDSRQAKIKSVTFRRLKIKKNSQGELEARVLFDI